MAPHEIVFLIDVDNTLLDNDAVIEDLKRHLIDACGVECQQRYWELFEQLREELGDAEAEASRLEEERRRAEEELAAAERGLRR